LTADRFTGRHRRRLLARLHPDVLEWAITLEIVKIT
jgi:hypothetical protein